MTPSPSSPLGKRKRADAVTSSADKPSRRKRSKRKHKPKGEKPEITSDGETNAVAGTDTRKSTENGLENRSRKRKEKQKKKKDEDLEHKRITSQVNAPFSTSKSPELPDEQVAPLPVAEESMIEVATDPKPKTRRVRTKRGRKNRHTQHGKEGVIDPKDAKLIISSNAAWSISSPIGGRLLDSAPRLSRDEKYLICATESTISAYATSTSSITQTLHVDEGAFFTTFDLSKTDPAIAWACTEQGTLYKWNFETGATVAEWTVPRHVQSIKVDAFSKTDDIIFTLAKKGKAQKSTISYLRPDHGEDVQSTVILTNDVPIRSIDVKEGGSVISAITLSGILIGSPSQSSTGQTPTKYVWREITCSEPPACFDVKIKAKDQRNAGKHPSTTAPQKWTVDVVVGGIRGCIYVFQDVLRRFEKTSKSGANISTASTSREQQLHWHRESVGSVTWSLDGQYIVSGGKETVLVLWQLETGRKQFLPNLESPINSIGVSPSGSSYSIRLADNSVMVLSTSELSPTSHVAGIQANSFTRSVLPAAHLPTVDLLHQFGAEAALNAVAATINPRSPEHLLLSVPSNQDSFTVGGPLSPAPYLQDFDISSGQFVSRQPLTRTNAINNNLGPEGNSIHEPHVKFLQTSNEGRWLASVDEWESPRQDVKHLGADGFDEPSTLESKLRFWLWNDEAKHWMLNSRIDEPHRPDSQANCMSVLALASDPAASRFATLGADSMVRFWTLKSKLKNGKVVRGEVATDAKGKSRTTDSWWAVESSIALEQAVAFDTFQSARPDRGILAFSNDGSMLAAYQHYDTCEAVGPIVHFIDTSSGTLLDSHNGLYDGSDGVHGLAFLGQYLIVVGRANAIVWDVTSFSLHAMIPLASDEDSSKAIEKLVKSGNMVQEPRPIPHLAVNVPTNTFAIAMPEPSRTNRKLNVHPLLKFKTRVTIYSPESGAEPVFEAQLPRTTLALMSAGGLAGTSDHSGSDVLGQKKGYVVLDLGAEVRLIKMDSAGMSSLPTPPPSDMEASEVTRPLEQSMDIEEDDEGDTVAEEAEKDGAMEVDDDDSTLPQKTEDTRPVVRREQLAEVFDHPSLAMPSMQDLFKGVLNLYVEKPVQRSPDPEGRNPVDPGLPERDIVDEVALDAEEDSESDSDSDSD